MAGKTRGFGSTIELVITQPRIRVGCHHAPVTSGDVDETQS